MNVGSFLWEATNGSFKSQNLTSHRVFIYSNMRFKFSFRIRYWLARYSFPLCVVATSAAQFEFGATGNLTNTHVSVAVKPSLPYGLPPMQVGLGPALSLTVPLRSADFQSAVSPASGRQNVRAPHRVKLVGPLHIDHPADWKSATGSLASAHTVLRDLPSLYSGNPFRRLEDGSSQQTENLRHGACRLSQSSTSYPSVPSLNL